MQHYRLSPKTAREFIEELRPFGHESPKTIPFDFQVTNLKSFLYFYTLLFRYIHFCQLRRF